MPIPYPTVIPQPPPFAEALLNWYRLKGRKDLPWQVTSSPYRTWISEIMLQQTQVETVKPYFERFIQRFPSIQALSEASEDEVLGAWSGLGYYRRGRALLASARMLVAEHRGEIPGDLKALLQLPGIGRSTAHAILALAFRQPLPILDGNVKRVLKRCCFPPSSSSPPEQNLWAKAFELVPAKHPDHYNQALMDVGALICQPRKVHCEICPLKPHCHYAKSLKAEEGRIPAPLQSQRMRRSLPQKPFQKVWMLWLWSETRKVLWLERVPPSFRVWQGLWAPPVWTEAAAWEAAKVAFERALGAPLLKTQSMKQACTHLDLHITLYKAQTSRKELVALPERGGRWVSPEDFSNFGLPGLIKKCQGLEAQLGFDWPSALI